MEDTHETCRDVGFPGIQEYCRTVFVFDLSDSEGAPQVDVDGDLILPRERFKLHIHHVSSSGLPDVGLQVPCPPCWVMLCTRQSPAVDIRSAGLAGSAAAGRLRPGQQAEPCRLHCSGGGRGHRPDRPGAERICPARLFDGLRGCCPGQLPGMRCAFTLCWPSGRACCLPLSRHCRCGSQCELKKQNRGPMQRNVMANASGDIARVRHLDFEFGTPQDPGRGAEGKGSLPHRPAPWTIRSRPGDVIML